MITALDRLIPAFEKRWFYVATLVIGTFYGLGGPVHIGNILGLGELSWSDAPVPWKLGDIGWGVLDIVAVVGIVRKAPVGIVAVACAALSQIVVYGLWPESFALNDEHFATLKGMVYFHVVILAILGLLLWLVTTRNSTR